MQIANVMVALGGRDSGTTVPKYGVSASEIQVLRAIHGEDAVFDIEPCGEVERTGREEIARLSDPLDGYGRARGGEGNQEIVKNLFPGGPLARAFMTIDELGLDESLFKPIARAKAEPATKPAKKSKAKEAGEAAPEAEDNLFE